MVAEKPGECGLGYVEEALRGVSLLWDLVEACREGLPEKEKKEVSGAGVARRAKDLPSMVSSAGLVPALTFYMSKADQEIYQRLYSYLRGRGGDVHGVCSAAPGDLRKELGGKEGAGYAALLALAAAFLAETGYLDPEPVDYRSLAEALRGLAAGTVRALAAERLLLEYLVEVKKLAEAFFKEEKKEG